VGGEESSAVFSAGFFAHDGFESSAGFSAGFFAHDGFESSAGLSAGFFAHDGFESSAGFSAGFFAHDGLVDAESPAEFFIQEGLAGGESSCVLPIGFFCGNDGFGGRDSLDGFASVFFIHEGLADSSSAFFIHGGLAVPDSPDCLFFIQGLLESPLLPSTLPGFTPAQGPIHVTHPLAHSEFQGGCHIRPHIAV
jgi:hypothetical protein